MFSVPLLMKQLQQLSELLLPKGKNPAAVVAATLCSCRAAQQTSFVVQDRGLSFAENPRNIWPKATFKIISM
jgi:hypothetical protein